MQITYKKVARNKTCTEIYEQVRLDGPLVGEIRKVKGGFQYFPKGQKEGGEIFKTKQAVYRSLES
jgi:hypothetical protein